MDSGISSPQIVYCIFMETFLPDFLSNKNATIQMYTLFENHRIVSFNIASEASYVFILGGQKFIKMQILRVFENLKLEVIQSYQKGQF